MILYLMNGSDERTSRMTSPFRCLNARVILEVVNMMFPLYTQSKRSVNDVFMIGGYKVYSQSSWRVLEVFITKNVVNESKFAALAKRLAALDFPNRPLLGRRWSESATCHWNPSNSLDESSSKKALWRNVHRRRYFTSGTLAFELVKRCETALEPSQHHHPRIPFRYRFRVKELHKDRRWPLYRFTAKIYDDMIPEEHPSTWTCRCWSIWWRRCSWTFNMMMPSSPG